MKHCTVMYCVVLYDRLQAFLPMLSLEGLSLEGFMFEVYDLYVSNGFMVYANDGFYGMRK